MEGYKPKAKEIEEAESMMTPREKATNEVRASGLNQLQKEVAKGFSRKIDAATFREIIKSFTAHEVEQSVMFSFIVKDHKVAGVIDDDRIVSASIDDVELTDEETEKFARTYGRVAKELSRWRDSEKEIDYAVVRLGLQDLLE